MREHLIKSFSDMAEALKEEEPNAAIVLFTLAASMCSNVDHKLAESGASIFKKSD